MKRSLRPIISIFAAIAALASSPAHGANATWTSNSNGNWSAGGNWSPATAPGSTSSTTNSDTAIIGNTTAVTINIDQANQNIGNILYFNNVAADTISGNPLLLSSGGYIINNNLVANAQIINSNLVLEGASSTTNGSYTISNNGGSSLALGGTISGGSTSGTVTLSLAGSSGSASNIVSGAISDGSAAHVALTKTGAGTWGLQGANTYTGTTTVAGGTLNLGTSSTVTSSIDGGNAGNLVLAGGALNFTALAATASSQSFANTTISPGLSSVSEAGKTGSALNLGTLTRNTGGILNVGTGTIDTASTTNTNGIIGGWAIANSGGWAVAPATSGGAIAALSTYTNDTWAAGNNTTVTLASNTLAANSTTNSLRFNAAGAATINLSGTNVIQSGGILETTGVGTSSGNDNVVITGGALTSGNGQDLIVFNNNNAGSLTIGSVIADNGGTSVGFTRGGRGGIPVILTGVNTYSGVTTLATGLTQIFTSSGLGNGASTNTINLNGGNLEASTNNIDLGTNRSIVVGGNGTTLSPDQGTVLTIDGTISGNGNILFSTGETILTGNNSSFDGRLQVGNLGSQDLQFSTSNNLGDASVNNSIIMGGGSPNNTTLEYTGSGAVNLGANRSITLNQEAIIQSDVAGATLTISGNIYNNHSNVLSLGGNGNITVSGAYANTAVGGSIAKFGTGTLDLSGANAFFAATPITVNGGTLELDYSGGAPNGTIISSTAPLTYTGASTLLLNSAGSGTTSQTVASLSYGGATTVQLTNNSGSTSTALTITTAAARNGQGTIDFIAPANTTVTDGSATNSFLGAYAFFGSGTSEGYAATTSGVVGLAASTAVTSSAGLTTSTVNYTYTAASTGTDTATSNLSANTINFDNTAGAETLALGTHTLTFGASGGFINTNGALTITGSAGPAIIGSTELILGGSSNINISAIIGNGAFVLTDSNSGTVVLSGANTFTGNTIINAGILNAQNNTALGAVNGSLYTVTVAEGATLQLSNGITVARPITINGPGNGNGTGALENLSGNNTYSGLVTLGDHPVISTDAGSLNVSNVGAFANGTVLTLTGAAGSGTIASSIGLGGAGSLVKSGLGTWTLSGANDYSGPTTINAGVLSLTGGSNAATTQVVNTTASTTITVNSTTGLAVGEIVTGTGIASNSYITAINSGTNQITLNAAATAQTGTTLTFGAYTGVGLGATTVASGATLSVSSNALQNQTDGITLNGAGATGQSGALVNATGTNSVAGLVSLGSSSTISSDSGTLNLTNTGDITGNIGNIGGVSTAFNLTLAGAGNGSVASIIGIGAGQLIKNGTGTWTVSGLNTYTGTTVVNNGALSFSTVGAGATAQGLGEATSLSLGNGGNAGTLVYTGGAGTLDKNVSALGTATDTIQNSGTGLLTLSGTLTKDGTKLALNGGANGIKVTGQITGPSANSDLIITGGATTLTNTSNNYNGPTYVQGGGTLVDNTTGAGAAVPTGTTLYVGGNDNSSGTFDLSGNNQSVASLYSQGTAGSSNVVTNNGTANATLTVTGGGNFAGTIKDGTSNSTGFKASGGTMILAGANTYTGATTVSAGTLKVTGSTASGSAVAIMGGTLNVTGSVGGTVDVQSGATLTGNGNGSTTGATGAVTVETGGNVNLQDSAIGKLTVGGLSTIGGAGGALTFEIGINTANSIDQIVDSGSLSIGSGTSLSIVNLGGGTTGQTLALGSYTLLSYTGTAMGLGNLSLSTASMTLDGYALSLSTSTAGQVNLIVANAGTGDTGMDYFNGTGTDLTTAASYDTSLTSGTPTSTAPSATSNLFFSASRNSSVTSGTVGSNLEVNSINFGTGGTTSTFAISGTGTITVDATNAHGNTAGSGITIASGGGSASISNPIALGADQSFIPNDATSVLTISGQVTGAHQLIKSGAGTVILSNASGNGYTGGTSVTAGRLLLANGSTLGSGSAPVSVSGSTAILGGKGSISGPVTVSSGGNLYSGATASSSTTKPGTGAVSGTTGGLTLSAALSINGSALTFALANGGAGNSYASPAKTTSFITTTGTVSFTGSDTINLVDLTNGGLSLRMNQPYLLISALSDSMFSGLVVLHADGSIGLSQSGGDGLVLGVDTGGNGTVGNPYTYTALTINEYGSDGVTPLTDSTTYGQNVSYLTPSLFLENGQLEVVPEPGTWALMLGGLALLIVIQRRRRVGTR